MPFKSKAQRRKFASSSSRRDLTRDARGMEPRDGTAKLPERVTRSARRPETLPGLKAKRKPPSRTRKAAKRRRVPMEQLFPVSAVLSSAASRPAQAPAALRRGVGGTFYEFLNEEQVCRARDHRPDRAGYAILRIATAICRSSKRRRNAEEMTSAAHDHRSDDGQGNGTRGSHRFSRPIPGDRRSKIRTGPAPIRPSIHRVRPVVVDGRVSPDRALTPNGWALTFPGSARRNPWAIGRTDPRSRATSEYRDAVEDA